MAGDAGEVPEVLKVLLHGHQEGQARPQDQQLRRELGWYILFIYI